MKKERAHLSYFLFDVSWGGRSKLVSSSIYVIVDSRDMHSQR